MEDPHSYVLILKVTLEKIQVWTAFKPKNLPSLVQLSTNWAIKPAGSKSLCEFIVHPRKMNKCEIFEILYVNSRWEI